MLISFPFFSVQPLGRAVLWPSTLERWGSTTHVPMHIWLHRTGLAKAFLAKEVYSHRSPQFAFDAGNCYSPQSERSGDWVPIPLIIYIYIFFSRLLSCIITVARAFKGCCGGCSHGEDDPFFTGCTANTIKGRASHLFMNIHLIHINALVPWIFISFMDCSCCVLITINRLETIL